VLETTGPELASLRPIALVKDGSARPGARSLPRRGR
jgi:hypothetical protein